jgi:hypothetical protein
MWSDFASSWWEEGRERDSSVQESATFLILIPVQPSTGKQSEKEQQKRKKNRFRTFVTFCRIFEQ